MKKIVLLISAVVLLLSGCTTPKEPMLKSGKLRAAITYELENSAEIAEYIAKELNAPLEITKADRSAALDMLSSGRADIAIGSFSDSNDPGLNFLMTMPIAENKIYIVCDGDISVTGTTDLMGRVAGASADLPESILRSLISIVSDGTLVCNNAKTAAELLKSGDIQAYVCFEEEALELLSENKELRCCIPADIDAERFGILVPKSKTALFGAVNGIVGKMITGEK